MPSSRSLRSPLGRWTLVALAATACTPAQGSKRADAGPSAAAAASAAALDDGGGADPSAAPAAGGAAGDAGAVADDSLPAAISADLTARGRHLLEAIAHDNPDLATDILFPRDAYAAAHEGQDPSKLWDKKILPGFQKDVHTVHRRVKDAEKAQFVSFEIGHAVTQITPKKRDWKKPLWRVRHSKLTFTIDGKTQRIEVSALLSWKGSWYVTNLR